MSGVVLEGFGLEHDAGAGAGLAACGDDDERGNEPSRREPRGRAGRRAYGGEDPGENRQGTGRSVAWCAALLAVVAIGVRVWLAVHATFCGTPDACFYLGLAQGMERTGTFHVNFLYDLLLPKLQLPSTGIEYWRPGTSFFLLSARWLPARWLGGVSLGSGAVMATLAGVAWAAAAWHVARSARLTRAYALPCVALALLLPPAWTGSLAPDSTLFYGAAVAWFLALFTVRRQGLWQDVLALGCVGVAYLIRNDALLLGLPLLTVLGLRYRARKQAGGPGRAPGSSPLYAGLMIAGFLLALVPMHLIYKRVLGTALPGGTAAVLWMRDLGDFNLYGARPTMAGLLAQGGPALLGQRVKALGLIAYRVPVLLLGYPALLLLPGLAGTWRLSAARPLARGDAALGRDFHRQGLGSGADELPELAGPVTFVAVLVLVYGLVLPAIGVFSTLRSVVGVLPWAAVLVIAGLRRAVHEPAVAQGMCAVLLLGYAVSGVMDSRRETEARNLLGRRDRAVAAGLAAMGARPASAVVMTADPVQFAVTTGYATVPLPGNGLDAARAEAGALGVTHAILDVKSSWASTWDVNREGLPVGEGEAGRVRGVARSVRMTAEPTVLLELERPAR